MMTTFEPRLDILPAAQRKLWPELKPVQQQGFVLYGGTAIALRLGHRQSVDFDFFSSRPSTRPNYAPRCRFCARPRSGKISRTLSRSRRSPASKSRSSADSISAASAIRVFVPDREAFLAASELRSEARISATEFVRQHALGTDLRSVLARG